MCFPIVNINLVFRSCRRQLEEVKIKLRAAESQSLLTEIWLYLKVEMNKTSWRCRNNQQKQESSCDLEYSI